MGKINRVIVLVLDSVGIGELPDAGKYGDSGADTLGHIIEKQGLEFSLPNLAKLGLYNLISFKHLVPPNDISGSFAKMVCASPGKDTTVGHWEMAGIVLDKPFPTYPEGFPSGVVSEFEEKIGTKAIGNIAASGTDIIKNLGDEHCRTGFPIIYTSADSVFQIAAHEEVFGLERLYEICRIARGILVGQHGVSRVIARPFTGKPGNFVRTSGRRDFSILPLKPTILDKITASGGEVTAIGKIEDIFCGKGITKAIHTDNNAHGLSVTLEQMSDKIDPDKVLRSMIFTNLVDFDMLWGHRRDVDSYARGLQEFDRSLPLIISKMDEEDILVITADHGCDPTFERHSDHTREFVPLLVYGKQLKAGVNMGIRSTFADLAQTIADIFGLEPMAKGTSFRQQLL